MSHATSPHRGAWYAKAIDNELSSLANLPAGNICKPSHPFAISIFKIASIAKGGNVSQLEALNAIKKTCAVHNWLPQKDIDYQWKRAYKNATPRHPKEQTSLPTVERESQAVKPEYLYEYDLKNDRMIFLREVPAQTVSKAQKLAAALDNFMETGEIPELPVRIHHTDSDAIGVTLSLQFKRYSQALADCVFIACARLKGFIWKDWKTGFFSVWIRTNQAKT